MVVILLHQLKSDFLQLSCKYQSQEEIGEETFE